MPITLDRSICCDFQETLSREWLLTNGIGGYAAGTVSGMLTRMEHGLLVAALPNTDTPQLLLAKIDEEVVFDQRTYNLGTNEYRDGTVNPAGFVHLEKFRLEDGFPVFTYHLGGLNGIMLEKRIWMPQGRNTTYIQYRVLRTASTESFKAGYKSRITGQLHNGFGRYTEYAEAAQRQLKLTLLPFVTHRPHDKPQYGNNGWYFDVRKHRTEGLPNESDADSLAAFPPGVVGCTIRAWPDAHSYHLLAVGHPNSHVTFLPTGVWYWNLLRRHEASAGQPATDDLYLPGVIRATLWSGDDATLTIAVSSEELSSQLLSQAQLQSSYKYSVEVQRQLVSAAMVPQRFFGDGGEAARADGLHVLPFTTDQKIEADEFLQALIQGADHFLALRTLPHDDKDRYTFFSGRPEKVSVLFANYYAMETGTRDALIALPGLALVTRKYDEALRLLRGLAHHFKRGLLPDHLPISGQTLQESDYGSADTTLWYFYAFDYYLRITHDYELLEELYHKLAASIDWYTRGTYNGIHVTSDGLLRAKEPGKALTWMNAFVDGVPTTPRPGKPVEVNALWYHALLLMHEWSQRLYQMQWLNFNPSIYKELATRCEQSFQKRFWYAPGGYLYDVIDGPEGEDTSLRPNQLLALSLRPNLVKEQKQRDSIFEVVTQQLLTPYGLRTLAPSDPAYIGSIPQYEEARARALHQGSVWSWLIGPYLDILLARSASQQEQLYQVAGWRHGLQLLEAFSAHLEEGLLGMNTGMFGGDAPHRASGDFASALSTGELLRVYEQLSRMKSTSLAGFITETV